MELGNNFVLKLEARERNICSVFSNAPPAVVDAPSDFVESYNVSLNIIALILSGIGDCASQKVGTDTSCYTPASVFSGNLF